MIPESTGLSKALSPATASLSGARLRPTVRTNREPNQPHGHLGGGWLARSLAERHDLHQHSAARARHSDSVVFDAAVEIAASKVLS